MSQRRKRHPRQQGNVAPRQSIYVEEGRGYVAYFRQHGRTERHRCKLYEEALQWLRAKQGDRQPLTGAEYLDAQNALAVLPEGATLLEAARHYARTHHAAVHAAPVAVGEAVRRFFAARGSFLATVSRRQYHSVLGRFEAYAGSPAPLGGVDRETVDKFLSGVKPSTRNSILNHLSAFMSWAVREGLLAANPCERVERARKVEPPLGVLSIGETAALLAAAERVAPRICAHLAIQLFAGVRPEEAPRLRDRHVRGGYILLDGSVTKGARARSIAIRPNLAAWLRAHPFAPLTKSQLRHDLEAARAAAGIACWPRDCLRHSFATYAYEVRPDAAVIAAEMGHKGTEVFFKHYRALAEPGAGQAYFGIVPGGERLGKDVSENGRKRPKTVRRGKAGIHGDNAQKSA